MKGPLSFMKQNENEHARNTEIKLTQMSKTSG